MNQFYGLRNRERAQINKPILWALLISGIFWGGAIWVIVHFWR
jgi:hypothetical protein